MTGLQCARRVTRVRSKGTLYKHKGQSWEETNVQEIEFEGQERS